MLLGHFEFNPTEDRLGEGPLSEVYRAKDTRLGRQVALKILRSTAEFDPLSDKRFMREGKMQASFSHPGITKIYEQGTLQSEQGEPQHYIAMELLEGHTLEDLIKERLLGIDECLRIATALSDAVGAVHERHMVHRDLKPANVFLTSDGKVKLMDFGIARAKNESAITQAGMLVGTVLFMSPEQVRGEKLTSASDVFSLGAVLYNLFTGKFPYPGRSFPEVCMAILDARPVEKPSEARPGLQPAIEDLLMQCLQADSKLRLENGGAVHAALLQLDDRLDGSTVRPQLAGSISIAQPTGNGAQAHSQLANKVHQELMRALSRNRNLEILEEAPDPSNRADARVLLELSLDNDVGILGIDLKHLHWDGAEAIASDSSIEEVHAEREESDTELIVMEQDLAFGGARMIRKMFASATRHRKNSETPETTERTMKLVSAAREQVHQGTSGQLTRSLLRLRQALEVDRFYAPAHAQMAETLVFKFLHYEGYEEHLLESRRSAAQALDLDPKCAIAHVALGFGYHLQGRTNDARREYRLALDIDANEWFAHRLMGSLQKANGVFTSARTHLERAVGLKPHDASAYDHLWETLVRLDKRDLADEGATQGIDHARNHLAEHPEDLDTMTHMGLLYARLGRADLARETVAKARQKAPKDGFVAFHCGLALAVLGDQEDAVKHLQRAIDRGYYVGSEIFHNPAFDPLRGREDFQAMMQ